MKVTLTPQQLENRVAWVKALRSPKFKQGHGYLKFVNGRETKHCCLGVACELVDPKSHRLEIYNHIGRSVGVSLDDDIIALFGMTAADQTRAVNWNDTACLTFRRIADLIAYATEYKMPFEEVQAHKVSENYSKRWLLVHWWAKRHGERHGSDTAV